MNLQDLQEKIADKVKSLDAFAALPVLREDKGNICADLEAEIAETNFAVVVGGLTFTDTKPNSTLAIGNIGITVSIFENPTFNREGTGHVTINEASQAIVKGLKLFNTGDGLLTNPSIGEINDLGDGVISTVVRLELTNVTL